MVVVKWSACLPITPTIRARIPLSLQFLSVKLFEKDEINEKWADDGHIKTSQNLSWNNFLKSSFCRLGKSDQRDQMVRLFSIFGHLQQ